MSVNSPDVLPYKLFNTRIVDKYVTPYWLTQNIKTIAVNCDGGKLAVLVLNCHGYIGDKHEFVGLAMGTGIYKADITANFSRLKGFVDVIHIPACQAAAGATGKAFCGELARVTQATVFAADVNQSVGFGDAAAVLAGGAIDSYEGQVFKFGSSGQSEPASL